MAENRKRVKRDHTAAVSVVNGGAEHLPEKGDSASARTADFLRGAGLVLDFQKLWKP